MQNVPAALVRRTTRYFLNKISHKLGSGNSGRSPRTYSRSWLSSPFRFMTDLLLLAWPIRPWRLGRSKALLVQSQPVLQTVTRSYCKSGHNSGCSSNLFHAALSLLARPFIGVSWKKLHVSRTQLLLRSCLCSVLAAQNLSEEAYTSFLDHTYLADRRTTVRQHLDANPQIMLELPPPELAERYGG
jgi:hypothetical protein